MFEGGGEREKEMEVSGKERERERERERDREREREKEREREREGDREQNYTYKHQDVRRREEMNIILKNQIRYSSERYHLKVLDIFTLQLSTDRLNKPWPIL